MKKDKTGAGEDSGSINITSSSSCCCVYCSSSSRTSNYQSCNVDLAGNVADMSPTCQPDTVMSANFSRKGMSQDVGFIPITADKLKSAQTYEYPSTRVFVFELKKQSRYCRHLKTCRDMSSNVVSFRHSSRHDIFLCLRHGRS